MLHTTDSTFAVDVCAARVKCVQNVQVRARVLCYAFGTFRAIEIDPFYLLLLTLKHYNFASTYRSAISISAKSKNADMYDILAHVIDPRVVKMNPVASTTLRLFACVASVR